MHRLAREFSLKTYAAGMAGGLCVMAAVLGGVSFQQNKTLAVMQDLLASKIVVIEKPGFAKDVADNREIGIIPAEPPQAPGHTTEHTPEPATEHEASSAHIPDTKELSEDSPQGKLPIIRSSDGMTPFKAYAKPFAAPSGAQAQIAIAISDFGLREDYSGKALLLHENATLLLSPYAEKPEFWQKKAQESGREFWLHLPMESGHYAELDPGPSAISATLLLPENEERLNGALSQITGYAGVVGFYTDHFKPVSLMMQTLAEQIFKRGLGYADLNPKAPETFKNVAKSMNAPYAGGVINLADPGFSGGIKEALELAEVAALDHQKVILVVPPYPALLETLKEWQSGLPAKGIAIAPLSAMTGAHSP